MKHTALFKNFMDGVVDLNTTRLGQLESSVEAIKTFIRDSNWEPRLRSFLAQGSWAQRTIIKPIAGSPFDADILVRVSHVDGWEPRDYINTLRQVFRESATYRDKVSSYSHCVTITYAGERKIDVAPLVVGRDGNGSEEVCNRITNAFESSDPQRYTEWFNERNGYSGSNSFRKVTRLLKYLRGIKKTFKCPSVLLTTLLGYRITWLDKNTTAFEDTPSALQTVMGRLDDYLQANATRPLVSNPSQADEDFGTLLTDEEYSNFRSFVNKYRGWIDDAIAEEDFSKSISAWQRIFGEEFGKGALAKIAATIDEATITVGSLLSSVAHHPDRLVEAVRDFGTRILPSWFYRPPHLHDPQWVRGSGAPVHVNVTATYHPHRRSSDERRVASGDTLPAHGGLWFEARLWGGAPIDSSYRVEWRVTNTGYAALSRHQGRGDFYAPSVGARRWEELSWRGVHFVEAFLIRRADDTLVGQSAPFDVVIL
ncbi:nucleotidyltransferase [Sphingobium sp. JS3065]|uniref:SMODS domain-containing nucleotidyltransferase n=1 Tax=Sphingobium sp. JS3065 TaxID=2970925 RepID=UPI0022646B69|nr:nucleotidyltransferase [Sphingobium sp. JS3065]UZW55610.1 nucleotidyltransferase [Sphingobium sp. JS3065]